MTGNRHIDLNADLGEFDSEDAIERDHAIMAYISSCNIACGGHAGTEPTMRSMLRAAKAAGVRPGAHPSYPDRTNFGRVSMRIAPDALRRALREQLETLATLAGEEGVTLRHVKPHGALYNDAADDADLALLIARVTADIMPEAALVGLAQSQMAAAAKAAKLRFIGEGFADRRYTRNARLQPRSEDGAVIEEQEDRIGQALALAAGKPIIDCKGALLDLQIDTICLHSDSDGALDSARLLRRELEAAGFTIGAQ